MKVACTKSLLSVVLVAIMALPAPMFAADRPTLPAVENLDYEMITRIRQEGFKDSHVMEIMSELTDRIGPRLTGSPQMKRANEWTRDQLSAWGLQNAHLEGWGPFGRGWSQEFISARMTQPDVAPLIAIPMAWTPGTNGTIRAKAVAVKIEKDEEMEKYHGKLEGAIVLFGTDPEIKPHETAQMRRYDEKGLTEVADYEVAGGQRRNFNREDFMKQRALREKLRKFWADEKVAAVVEPGRGDGGTVFVQSGGGYKKGEEALVPMVAMASEHYARIARLLKRDVPVERSF